MNKILKTFTAVLVFASGIFLTACGSSENESSSSEPTLESLSSIELKTKPEGAIPLGEAKQSAQSGDKLIVLGQIGGTLKPFTTGYAGFVLSDEEVVFCDEMEDDHCSTPWDACCEDKEKLKANRASVQFVDAEGIPLSGGLKGVEGLQELEKVIIVGEVALQSTPNNLVINASGLYRMAK